MSITLENKDGLVDEEENLSGGELCDAARVGIRQRISFQGVFYLLDDGWEQPPSPPEIH